ncbi:MAG: putative porin [Reichenbachiella sp.]|uniref:putative porin n=1 Tax=Reichenbachiella sp. TaxID=2184521 RepID=UPI0032640993
MAQNPDSLDQLSFTGDFRIRVEEDWNSRKSDGSYRTDRTRLRYRMRFGAAYQYNEHWKLATRIRTGNPRKQQDPQLTLGDESEFGTLSLGFEKLYVSTVYGGFGAWAGKNTFPFTKQNELFWSDNVYPEGLFASQSIDLQSAWVDRIKLGIGHFIITSNNESLGQDNYFQGIQFTTSHFNERLELFPSFYYFKNTPDLPDGGANYTFNYSFFHFGSSAKISKKPIIEVELDYYLNLQDYESNDSIPQVLKNQKTGFTAAISIGQLKEKNDWKVKLTYIYLERYAAVDFLAQNDWARWDYSADNSPDGRLTNLKGLELMMGYSFNEKFTLNMRSFFVDQLIAMGPVKESNSRIRLDLDIGF